MNMNTAYRTHSCGELRMEHVGQTVTLAGFMENIREVGQNFAFVILRDFYGTTQVVVETEEMMQIFKGLNKESTVAVTGTVRERDSKNPKLPTGDIELVGALGIMTGNPDGSFNKDNGADYPALVFSREEAIANIKSYMSESGYAGGESDLEITFTIAGANLTDHPTYAVFQLAADILNECGWDIEVVSDTQALTKLSTGSLAVWAAAWGSTVDPDMYQVYHKNSTATSVLAWGYKQILANPGQYVEETAILNELSNLIDDARETTDREVRTELYKQCMELILDLAIELPVYQRDVLYAYNSNVIDSSTLPTTINPYTSPIDKIWEIDFAK